MIELLHFPGNETDRAKLLQGIEQPDEEEQTLTGTQSLCGGF